MDDDWGYPYDWKPLKPPYVQTSSGVEGMHRALITWFSSLISYGESPNTIGQALMRCWLSNGTHDGWCSKTSSWVSVCSHLLLLCQIQVVFLLEDFLNKQSDDLVTLFGTTQKREQKTGTGHIDLQKANKKFSPYNSEEYLSIWVNYNISLTWIKAIWGWFPLLTMTIVRSQWGRYNLPRFDIHGHTPLEIHSPNFGSVEHGQSRNCLNDCLSNTFQSCEPNNTLW